MPKPMKARFEDELGELVDRYLKDGLSPADIVFILNYEAQNDYAERKRELEKQQ